MKVGSEEGGEVGGKGHNGRWGTIVEMWWRGECVGRDSASGELSQDQKMESIGVSKHTTWVTVNGMMGGCKWSWLHGTTG